MPDDRNLNAGAPSGTLAKHVDQLAARFDAAWQAGQQPRIEQFLGDDTLAHNPAGLRQMLLELVRLDLRWRWQSPPAETLSSRMASEQTDGGTGVLLPSRPKLEDYCRAYPTLGPLDGLPDELITAEYEARHRYGDKPSHAHYRERFPGKAEQLVELLRKTDAALASTTGKCDETIALPAGSSLDLRPITREQFLHNIEESGLMTAGQATELLESLPPKESAGREPGDGCDLAARLVQAGRLTPYQAEQLCRGETGMLAFDEYTVLDRLGAGGMGEVLKAEHRSMGRMVAVKVLAPKLVDSPDAVKRFHREVRAAARLIHPNIVTAFDAREHAGRHCLVMEYVEGHDLGQIIKRQGPLPVAEAVEYIVQAARGLQFAHEHGIVHRDIKPANLLLQSPFASSSTVATSGSSQATVKILDMGLARLDDAPAGDDEADDDRLTGSSQMMGTCDYMAPEQAIDTHNVDHRADIYALGCTLYRLVTGKRPYTGCTPVQVLMAHREAPIPSLREGRDDVSPQLDAVYQRMVAKKPEDRQRSMAEVIEELSACCVSEEAEQGPSDIALKAFLHGVAAEGGTGLSRGPAAPSTGKTSGRPGVGSGLSTVAGSTLAPAAPRAPSVRNYLLVGGMAMIAAVLAGMLAILLWPAKPAGPGRGTLALEGPLDQVRVAARHEQESDVRFLEPDAKGHVELREGVYRLALARGHEQYKLVPNAVTIAPGKQVSVRIESTAAKASPPMAVAPFDATTAKKHQQAWADYLGVPVEWENSVGMKFVLIPPGEFMMGTTDEEANEVIKSLTSSVGIERIRSEQPRHRHPIRAAFYLGKHEVTRGAFRQFVEASKYVSRAERYSSGAYFTAEGKLQHGDYSWRTTSFEQTDDCPVVNVTGSDAKAFCQWLSEKEKRSFRLPTEPQWEYACRAGTVGLYGKEDQESCLQRIANVADQSCAAKGVANKPHESFPWDDGYPFTAPVGRFDANPFGLHDMLGNAFEFCADGYDSAAYARYAAGDFSPPLDNQKHVVRGGTWRDGRVMPFHCARRYAWDDSLAFVNFGFRIACEIPDTAKLTELAAAIRAPKVEPQPPAKPASESGATSQNDLPVLPNGWHFDQPVNLGSVVNSNALDGDPTLSADGRMMVFHSQRAGGQGENDLWMCRRESAGVPFGKPVNLGPKFNSPGHDYAPDLSADGSTLVFASQRSGGSGGSDLWMCIRGSGQTAFGEPVNLGSVVNSEQDEGGPLLSSDGLTLLFNSKRRGGHGDFDLWMSERPTADTPFGEPTNLGPNVNGSSCDGDPALSPDGLTLIFTSRRPGGQGGFDLWTCVRPAMNAPFLPAVNLGRSVNTHGDEGGPMLASDGSALMFTSNRPGGLGDCDLWMCRRIDTAATDLDVGWGPWEELFDGKTLGNWVAAENLSSEAQPGRVWVSDGTLRLETGRPATVAAYTGTVPSTDYEIQLEAMRTSGGNVFCGLSFPVGEDKTTLQLGGFGGRTVGLHHLDGKGANNNITTKLLPSENRKWYHIRVQVLGNRIIASINGTELFDLDTRGHTLAEGYCNYRPLRLLSIHTWQTPGAFRNIRLRRLQKEETTSSGEVKANRNPPPAVAPFDAEQAKKHQQSWADYLGVSVEWENSIGMKFVLIPPGEFLMGSTEEEVAKLREMGPQETWFVNLLASEVPQHRVVLSRPFYLGREEVSVGQFRRFADDARYLTEAEKNNAGGRGFDDERRDFYERPEYTWSNPGFQQTDHHAVGLVTWNDAQEFCRWLHQKEGRAYHLPTEAQWEFACRAGTISKWSAGDVDESLRGFANLADITHRRVRKGIDWGLSWDDGYGTTATAEGFRANPFGLVHMHGNVWEWCRDWFSTDFYGKSPAADPFGPSSGKERTIRGGAFDYDAVQSRSASRRALNPGMRSINNGFRVGCEIPDDPAELQQFMHTLGADRR